MHASVDDRRPTAETADPRNLDRQSAWLLALITLVAVGLRFWQCRESLWLDETHTAWTVAGGLATIPSRARAGNYGPVYFYLPWVCTRLFGMHEWTLRLPSLIAGVLLVPVCYGIVTDWFRSRTLGLLAAALAATDPHGLFYSLDARPYALVQVGSAAHVWLLVRLLQGPKSRAIEWVAFCLLGSLLFQWHFTTGLLFTAEATLVAVAFFVARRQDAKRAQHAAVWAFGCLVLIGASCLTSIRTIRFVANRRQIWNHFIDRSSDVLDLFPWDVYVGTALLVAAACWLVDWWWSPNAERRDPIGDSSRFSEVASPIGWTLTWLILPVTIAAVLTRLDIARVFYRRYTMYSYPALFVLAAGLGAIIPSRRGRIVFAIVVVGSVSLSIGPYGQLMIDCRVVRHSHEDWRQAVAVVNHARTDRLLPVLVRTGLVEEQLLEAPLEETQLKDKQCSPVPPGERRAAECVTVVRRLDASFAACEYLLFPVSSIYQVKNDVFVLTSRLEMTSAAGDRIRAVGGCWLIIRGKRWFDDNEVAILRNLETRLRKESTAAVIERHDYGNVVVIRVHFEPKKAQATDHSEDTSKQYSRSWSRRKSLHPFVFQVGAHVGGPKLFTGPHVDRNQLLDSVAATDYVQSVANNRGARIPDSSLSEDPAEFRAAFGPSGKQP